MPPLLIIISGLSCTGKTTLSKKIADQYNLPLIAKDSIKESLFDSLGYLDRDYSKKIGAVSYKLTYELIDELLSKGISLITETNFKPSFDNEIFTRLIEKHNPKVLQIHCIAKPEILMKRFKARSESGERHPGHVDHQNYAEFEKMIKSGEYTNLDIECSLLKIDTSNFDDIDDRVIDEAIAGLKVFRD